MKRRSLLAVLIAAAIGGSVSHAQAQNFTKPVRIIVPFAAGGTSDILARLIGPKLQEAIGQPVVVENKTGGGGNIAADFVAKADKDGHTLLLSDLSTIATAPSLYANMTYSPTKDLTPVGMILFAPYVLAVTPSLSAKSIAELVAEAKANPGKLLFANAGLGFANHIGGVQLEKGWGVQFKHVPYRGGADAIKGVLSGESQLILNGVTATASFVTQGQLRGLAVSGDIKAPQLPDVPTFKELGLNPVDMGTWQGILTTGGTPAPTVARLNTELNKILAMPEIAQRIASLGGQAKPGSAAELGSWMEKNAANFAVIIKEVGIKPQ